MVCVRRESDCVIAFCVGCVTLLLFRKYLKKKMYDMLLAVNIMIIDIKSSRLKTLTKENAFFYCVYICDWTVLLGADVIIFFSELA